VLSATTGSPSRATVLGIEGTRFTLDGRPAFLLGISYYAALGAPPEYVAADLADLKQAGINWIRVWATWNAFGDCSAVDPTGLPRQPYFTRLCDLVPAADEMGMIVDVTLTRGEMIPDQQAHLQAVRTLSEALKRWRNVYFDVANERNIKDARHVSLEDCGELCGAIKAIDPGRLVTASHAGDIAREELAEYLQVARVDFITPHRPRNGSSAAQTEGKTREYLQWMAELGAVVPVHYQEPFRRDFGEWQPESDGFLTDLRGAVAGGAAGWCLHNGSPRNTGRGEEGPRRSFDLGEGRGRLMEQLDEVELAVLAAMAGALR